MIAARQLPLLAAEPPTTERPLGAVHRDPGARESLLAEAASRGASFHEVPVKAILNPPATTGMGFWSLNPYVGCEFGCTYCYARETHKWRVERASGTLARRPDASTPRPEGEDPGEPEVSGSPAEDGPDARGDEATRRRDDQAPRRPGDQATPLPPWLAFEKQILVKTTAAAVLQRTLFPAKLAGASLVIGTATDPYQPAERRFRLTREILEALLGWKGLELGIITKSPLVIRDIDILKRLSERHDLSVNISLATVDAPLLRRLEARSPAPHARLRAVERLAAAGIRTGLMIAPILPGITDSRESLSAVLQAGKAAGAHYAHGAALRLGPAARSRFLPHLEHEFPELGARYHRRYDHQNSAGKDYTEALSLRMRGLLEEHGFPVPGRWRDRPRGPRKTPEVVEQWGLF